MSLVVALQTLKAAADPTRLRLLALLANGEATVGELQEILEQSQPRVSRHLRLLDEAGLVVKFRDGHWIYYRLAFAPSAIVAETLALVGHDDEQVARDRTVLDRVKRDREREVFRAQMPNTAGVAERPSIESLAEALDECIDKWMGDGHLGDVLDVGCGSGSLLRLLGQRARRAVGIDKSRRMRLLARSRLHQAGLANCTVRKGDLVKLPFDDDSFDLVILDEVLEGCNDVLAGLREARRVLHPTGQLLVIDRVRPIARQLPDQRDSARLIENQLTAMLSEIGYRVAQRIWFPGRVMEFALFAAVPDNQLQRTGTYD
jgi:ArsR family transcriptional regulator